VNSVTLQTTRASLAFQAGGHGRGATSTRTNTEGGAAGALPVRVKVLDWGRNETSEGPVIVDELTARIFSANQKAIGRERVALDYEHNTVPGTAEYRRTQEPREIGGSLNLVCVPGQGIFGEAITYTASGTQSAGNYEDLSLAPYLDAERRVIAAHSVALTRAGAAYGIHFVDAAAALSAGSLQLAAELKTLSAPLKPTINSGDSGINQPTNKNIPMDKFVSLTALAGLVGLSAEADEASVMHQLKNRLVAGTELTPLTARLEAIEKRFTDHAAATTTVERSRLITLMAGEGKAPVNPATNKAYTAEELKGLDLATLQLLQLNTAVTVPLSARGKALDGKILDPNRKGRDRTIAALEIAAA
jgi:hypothetical protein